MPSRIHLFKHAESITDVTLDWSKPDPSLTVLGLQQASQIIQDFPYSSSVTVIITSPLKRAVETTLAGFSHILDASNYPSSEETAGIVSACGIKDGAKLIIDPDLQELSDHPCDTGSNRNVLEASFPGVSFNVLDKNWQIKEGGQADDGQAIEARAKKVKTQLAELVEKLRTEEKKDIVVITHGNFMQFLSGDPNLDIPVAGWASYTIEKDRNEEINLVPVK